MKKEDLKLPDPDSWHDGSPEKDGKYYVVYEWEGREYIGTAIWSQNAWSFSGSELKIKKWREANDG